MGVLSVVVAKDHHQGSKPPASAFRSFCLLLFLVFASVYVVFLLFLFRIGAVHVHYPHPPASSSLPSTPNTSAETELEVLRDMLRDSVTFLPLRNATIPTRIGGDWFISSVEDTYEEGEAEYRYFPSESSKGRLLCLVANDRRDGSRNTYAFAWSAALPRGATLLRGPTYVSDSYFNYNNIWHGITALVPFVSWHQRKGCVPPARWVLFHCGALQKAENTIAWVRTLAKAVTGTEMKVEDLESYKEGPVCFEEAIVHRHNEGKMMKPRRQAVYDIMRCKARHYCNVTREVADPKVIQMTLFLRHGARSFKNESEAIEIFAKACDKFDGCKFKYRWTHNLTFCEQVKLMTETDLLVTQHGAQVTNGVFMEKGSGIMEIYPKGWKEYAGNGQYVYRWMADWVGMRHKGSWWESIPDGETCPHTDRLDCFFIYKDGQVGHDEAYFSDWAAKALAEVREDRNSTQPLQAPMSAPNCACM